MLIKYLTSLFVFLPGLLLLLTLIGNPSPEGIGPIELIILVICVICLVIAISKIIKNDVFLDKPGANLMFWLTAYIFVWIASSIVGLTKGIPLINSLRSSGPYILFLPVVLFSIAFKSHIKLKHIYNALIFVGLLHSGYVIYLYITNQSNFEDLESVLIGRITLIDIRTILPLLLSLAVLPLPLVMTASGLLKRLIGIGMVLLSVLAALSTQVRAELLAIVTEISLYFYLHYNFLSIRTRHRQWQQNGLFLIGAISITAFMGLLVFLIPPLRVLAMTNIVRTQRLGDNGRIQEEWLPAIEKLLSQPVDIIFGMGSGVPFLTLSGDWRTYVHNLLIYLFVYSGIVGVLISLIFYLYLYKTLLLRAKKTRNVEYLALAALLMGLFVYVQLFAVHKVLSYNLMLFLICAASFLNNKTKNNNLIRNTASDATEVEN